jgi:hypothetical protein
MTGLYVEVALDVHSLETGADREVEQVAVIKPGHCQAVAALTLELCLDPRR